MKALVDIVNFNADASCLPSEGWLRALEGGRKSAFARWLSLFIERNKPMVLGISGAAAADIAGLCAESIDLIRDHPDIFQIIARPFAHDAALLRSPLGFESNLKLGISMLEAAFGRCDRIYLPPEFMLTVEQVGTLSKLGLTSTIINSARYTFAQQDHIPNCPYRLHGLFGCVIGCIPVAGHLTRAYLASHDEFSAFPWNEAVLSVPGETAVSWRDGESWLLMPEGLDREARWLDEESAAIRRVPLAAAAAADLQDAVALVSNGYRSYPLHPLTAWLKEFKMLHFSQRVETVEKDLGNLPPDALALWTLCINSDILSSVEKQAVHKRMKKIGGDEYFSVTLHRSERWFEGSEYLGLLEAAVAGQSMDYLWESQEAHIRKARLRIAAIHGLEQGAGVRSPGLSRKAATMEVT